MSIYSIIGNYNIENMITRCCLEIIRICNPDCVCCPKTKQKKHNLLLEEYHILMDKIAGNIKFLSLLNSPSSFTLFL